MNRERLDNWCEKGILGLVLAILVYGPLATGAVRPQDFLVIQFLTVGVLALWMVRAWANPEHRLLWPPVCWAVLAFVVYAIVRYRQADIEYVARTELIKILVYAGLFFAIVNNLNRQESSQVISFALIFLAVGISAYALYQFTTKSDRVWHFIRPWMYAGRGSGTYICPNHLAGFLELILPVALAFTIMGRVGHLTRIVMGYCAVVMLAGIGVSISRGGIVATVIALIIFFAVLVRKPGYRVPAFILLAVLLGAGIWFFSTAQYSQKRFQTMLVNGRIEDIRFELWRPAIAIWKDHFWWGAGPAHFDQEFPQYRPEIVQARPDRVHNDYLNTLADWGVAGMALVGAICGLAFWGVLGIWKSVQRTGNGIGVPKSNRTAFALGAGVGLLAIALHSWVDFNMHIPANAIIAVCWLALLAGYWRFATDRYWILSGTAGRAVVTLVAAVSIFYLAGQAVRRYREWALLKEIIPGKTLYSRQLAILKQACAVEPQNPAAAYQMGEVFRGRSWQGRDDYVPLAKEAMQWFETSMRLNPHDPLGPLRYGMCLDWLDEHEKATPYFQRALALDPNGYYVVSFQGWHLVQDQQYALARPWFERSLRLESNNPFAETYLQIIDERLKEGKR